MNSNITFDDYAQIGMMETALSGHADEAFFELSEDEQKIAEKIFKCLTETDRENREIRRATSIERLCAVAEADFSEVAAIVETFRREGRTFLMPPSDIPLNENTLIDISHESLIRKWERLKKWVEEEGQSSRTYRRLAEDALLHQQGKAGFWSEPELSDAVRWREEFLPNETWAQLYKEKGEKQYRASFADAMTYLDESRINREEEVAADERQQKALKKYAAKLRWTVIGLIFFSVLTLGAAVFAFAQMKEAVRVRNALAEEKTISDNLTGKLLLEAEQSKIARDEREEAFIRLKTKTDELENSEEKLSESLELQTEATKKAKEEETHAKLSEAEKVKALEKQKQLSAEAESAKNTAIKQKEAAVVAQRQAEAAKVREETNREALTLLEQGEYRKAEPVFEKLLASYKNESEPMSEEIRDDGKWWALHNLGIVNSKLNEKFKDNAKFEAAESSYIEALGIVGESQKVDDSEETEETGTTQSQYSGQLIWQRASYQTDNEKNRNKITTLRRLAQLYREHAVNATDENLERKHNILAIKRYKRLIDILQIKSPNTRQPSYSADVHVELADCYADLDDYDANKEAKKHYKTAEETYKKEESFIKQVVALKKWADITTGDGEAEVGEYPFDLLKKAIEIQENIMNLSPVDPEIADSYEKLFKAAAFSNQLDTSNEESVDRVDSSETGEIVDQIDYIDTSLPYSKLFESINSLNSALDEHGYLSGEIVRETANAYLRIGKCRRAEKVYRYAIDKANQPGSRSEQFRNSSDYAFFLIDLAELYQNILPDEAEAETYFDKFYVFIDIRRADPSNFSYPYSETFIKAGDYYFARENFERAGELYKFALAMAEKRDDNLNVEKDVILSRAELIVKIARISEKQKNLKETEEKYLEAVNLIALKLKETDTLSTARFLIYLADFYEVRGRTEESRKLSDKAEAILTSKAETILKTAGKLTKEELTLQIQIEKMLGDMKSADTAIAAKHYENAISNLDKYYKIQYEAAEDCIKECGIATRYTQNGKTTEEYWIDKAEILESWLKLKGVENTGKLEKRLLRIQKILKTFKLPKCSDVKGKLEAQN